MNEIMLRFIWKCKRPKIAKTTLKNNKIRRLADSKGYFKAAEITGRLMSPGPETDLHICGQLICYKCEKTAQWRKDSHMHLKQRRTQNGGKV